MQLLEERDAELERSEASLEGCKKAGDAREAVSSLPSQCTEAASAAVCCDAVVRHLHSWASPACVAFSCRVSRECDNSATDYCRHEYSRLGIQIQMLPCKHCLRAHSRVGAVM